MTAVKFIIIAVISYLIGSLNFSILLSRKIGKKDIREMGSGNAGATNMFRSYGKKLGALTMLADILKAIVAIVIAMAIIGNDEVSQFPYIIKSFAGFFCVIGHLYPVFFNFKGGKGVATCAGMILILDWRVFLIELAVFILCLLIFKMVSLGSVVMAFLYPFLTYFLYHSNANAVSGQDKERIIVTIVAALFGVIVIYKHKSNIVRICQNKENKMDFAKIFKK